MRPPARPQAGGGSNAHTYRRGGPGWLRVAVVLLTEEQRSMLCGGCYAHLIGQAPPPNQKKRRAVWTSFIGG